MPLSMVIIIIVVGAFSTMTFLYAIYYQISTYLATRRSKDHGPDKDNPNLPLTEAAAPLGTNFTNQLDEPPISRPETPEAESPPPLEPELEAVARAETPPPLRDSTHEIIEMYTTESRRNHGPPSKSAPAAITTFAMAESKWAYFGQIRAQTHDFQFDFV